MKDEQIEGPYKKILHRPGNEWEYKFEQSKEQDGESLIKFLNIHGLDGWELVSFTSGLCIFKRPIH